MIKWRMSQWHTKREGEHGLKITWEGGHGHHRTGEGVLGRNWAGKGTCNQIRQVRFDKRDQETIIGSHYGHCCWITGKT